jgi:putative transposase
LVGPQRPSCPPKGTADLRRRGNWGRCSGCVNRNKCLSVVYCMIARYAKNAGAVFSLKYHLVWCPKYRRPVLTGEIEVRLKALLHEIAAGFGWTVRAMEVMPDHVHIFVETRPEWAVTEVVNRFKGITSRLLRAEFRSLVTRLPTLWSRSYFAASVGAVSDTTIRRYIEAQKGV